MTTGARGARHWRLAEIARCYGLKLVCRFDSQSHLGLHHYQGFAPELPDPLADLDIGVVLLGIELSPLERPTCTLPSP